MEDQWDWKLFEATGAVGAYLRYKANSREAGSPQEVKRKERESRDAPADDHGPGGAGHQNRGS